MSIDVLFKKYFYVLVCVLVALAAFFQASGVSYLVGAQLAEGSGPTFPPAAKGQSAAVSLPKALPILERNPFDHITGSLVGGDEPDEPKKRAVEVDDPLAVPLCAGVKVHILTESDDPLWSFAAVSGGSEKEPVIKRVGDDFNGKKVAYIGFNPRTASPTVWLESDTLCQSSLFGAEPPAGAKPEAAAPTPAKPVAKRANGRKVPDDIASKIRKISDTEFEIDRSAVDKILEDQSSLMRSARIVPEQKDGKTVGVRLFGVRPETLLGHLGLKNGDRLETINGFNMGSPEKALEAYARLRTADSLKITLNRRGKPTTIELKIK